MVGDGSISSLLSISTPTPTSIDGVITATTTLDGGISTSFTTLGQSTSNSCPIAKHAWEQC